jgi:acyl CoA:acetate/3-ketoacid CoA transferase beta subunit
MYTKDFTLQELMIIEGSRHINDGEVVFVGSGLPIVSVMLAQRTHAPNLVFVVETGPIAPSVFSTPLSVSDPRIWHRAVKLGSLRDVLGCILQRGLCDVGFIGGAQIDQYGNVNSTVIGDYFKPKVRLPGSGGANDIASLSKRTLITTKHEKRRFPKKCDYITSPGYINGPQVREKNGLSGGGPDKVITDLCTMDFNKKTGRMRIIKTMPGVTKKKIKETMMFEPEFASKVGIVDLPTNEYIQILRKEVDPEHIYLKG